MGCVNLNVLFLTLINMEDIQVRGIYTDLIREMAAKGINMYVVSPREKRSKLPTELEKKDNINVLKVKVGNITKVAMIEKGISTIRIENQYLKAIKEYFADIKFDMVMYSTPPITFEKIVTYFKKTQGSKTYLVLKDIFPQNAVDLEMMKENSLIWKYFRKKEQKLYEISDVIGCMSQANLEYIIKHNDIPREKIEVFPNSIKPLPKKAQEKNNTHIYDEYNIPKEDVLYVYGGNLGKPQGIDFLIEVIKNFHKVKDSYLLIVGSGTEFDKINNYILKNKPTNVKLLKRMPKHVYDQLLDMTDVGLIFLDKRFTIPNFPSRLTAYMESSIPVLAATDKHTDIKDVIIESESGYWSESGEIDTFIENAKQLSRDKSLRIQMGQNGREYLEANYDVTKTVNIILSHL